MKTPSISLACLCFASLLFAPVVGAQDNVHTVYGSARPNTTDDLQKAIVQFPYTWEVTEGKASVAFKADGTGKQTFFGFAWRIKGPQEIELNMTGSTVKALIHFNPDYASYTGVDFDGRVFRGSVVMPKTATAPTPAIAAATPAPVAPAATPSMAAAPVPAATATPSFFDAHPTTSTSLSDALQKGVSNSRYSWEHETGTNKETIFFAADGTGRHSFFNVTWRVKSQHEIEVTINEPDDHRKAVFKFNADFTKYTATDFDGSSPLKGHKLPQ